MPRTLILTGPSAAGKNAIAAIYSTIVERCAVIDVDVVRWMVVKPHVAPWDGDEGRIQHDLGVRNACAIASNLIEAGFDVLILDVVSEEHAQYYKEKLAFADPKIIRLMPSYGEVINRNLARMSAVLKLEQIDFLYDLQVNLRTFDQSIDNTHIPAVEVARMLLDL
jgi:hypothetical protein